MIGSLLRREYSIANQTLAFAADDNEDLTHNLDLIPLHYGTPTALACSGIFPERAGTATSGVVLASFINRHTDAREMPCFLAT